MYAADLIDPSGKRVLVVGLGHFGGGIAVARHFAQRGACVTVTDLKPDRELAESISKLDGLDIMFKLGGHDRRDFAACDIVVPSPAVPPEMPLLAVAVGAGAVIETEMNLFLKLCPATVVGVTGSNGKSTTAALAHAVLAGSGRRTWLGGNIGVSLLEKVRDISPFDLVVVELSSFQLEDLGRIGFSPEVAVVTNLAPNHLDRHHTVEAYYAAKRNIIRFQRPDNVAVLNLDDPVLADWARQCPSHVVGFSTDVSCEHGACIADGAIRVSTSDRSSVYRCLDGFRLPGRHNQANLLAAVACAHLFHTPARAVERAAGSFKALPHRLELVDTIDGVPFYDDSIATTPESAAAAVGSFDAPPVVIAGGYDKKLPFDVFTRALSRRARAVILIGATARAIADGIENVRTGPSPEVLFARTLPDAVGIACAHACAPGAVVLSPACASYDMFDNFEHRARVFAEAVAAAKRGATDLDRAEPRSA